MPAESQASLRPRTGGALGLILRSNSRCRGETKIGGSPSRRNLWWATQREARAPFGGRQRLSFAATVGVPAGCAPKFQWPTASWTASEMLAFPDACSLASWRSGQRTNHSHAAFPYLCSIPSAGQPPTLDPGHGLQARPVPRARRRHLPANRGRTASRQNRVGNSPCFQGTRRS